MNENFKNYKLDQITLLRVIINKLNDGYSRKDIIKSIKNMIKAVRMTHITTTVKM